MRATTAGPIVMLSGGRIGADLPPPVRHEGTAW